MPYQTNGKRDYDKEKTQYEDKHPERAKARVKRKTARRRLTKEGVVSKGDGKHVDHKKPLSKGGSNQRSNLKAVPAKQNLNKEAKAKQAKATSKARKTSK